MSDSWLEHFEARLDLLEQTTSDKEARFSRVLHLAQSAFEILAPSSTVVAYLVQSDQVQQLDENGRACLPDQPEATIRASANAGQPANGTNGRFVGVSALANDIALVCHFPTAELAAPITSCREGAEAVTAVVATYVSRHLLSQYETRLASQAILLDMVSQLANSRDLREAATIAVNDGANFLGDCRLSLLTNRPDKLSVIAVTGVSDPKQMSETLTSIEHFVQSRVSESKLGDWVEVSELDASEASVADLFSQSNVRQLQVLSFADEAAASSAPNCCLLVESFDETAVPDSHLLQQLVNTSGPTIQKHIAAGQPLLSRVVGSRKLRRLLIAAAALVFLAVWPADFEIEVTGQIQATNWQRIYAPDNGTIETVSFTNEAAVKSGESLLTMSNPNLELQLQQVSGDILTTMAKLASARTTRLTGNDPQASINEQILQTQLKNLEADRKLIQEQAGDLVVKAPFNGTVFLRDPQSELAMRPVQRGQLLLQIVQKDTNWQLELNVPDQMRQHLMKYKAESDAPVPVRYLIKASTERDWTTTLTSVDDAVQVSGTELVCKANAVLAELPSAHQRPGTSVTARIYCGRRSVGFVWFREVLEFWQQFHFAWL